MQTNSLNRCRCWKNGFWFTTLLYPSCSRQALQLFSLITVDIGIYLKADVSILVKPIGGSYSHTYWSFLIPGIVLMIIFAALMPAFYFGVLYINRFRLDVRPSFHESSDVHLQSVDPGSLN